MDNRYVSAVRLLAVLTVLAMPSYGNEVPIGVSPGSENNKATEPRVIVINEQRIPDHLGKRSLTDVLTILSAKSNFSWEAPTDLLDFPISSEYRQEPLLDVFDTLLRELNYVVITDDDGTIVRLLVTGRKSQISHSEVPIVESALVEDTSNLETIEAFDSMTEEQRLAFEIGGQALAPPPEMLDLFEPIQTPSSKITGPPSPLFTQQVSGQGTQEANRFSSSTKSNPNDEQIESFEPYVSDTGPPTSREEQ